ncbi:hypothetical protein CO046_00130 [Candidatus Peregrinibacteria bacterium CG_4_9_14_0_2_um_filter_53_11]|nr:MAG: hypothetical protein CO046_00130 [Candidatus Peregrinibacteria bacterium CG_4_9_14_0_2_um_filter_53_11]
MSIDDSDQAGRGNLPEAAAPLHSGLMRAPAAGASALAAEPTAVDQAPPEAALVDSRRRLLALAELPLSDEGVRRHFSDLATAHPDRAAECQREADVVCTRLEGTRVLFKQLRLLDGVFSRPWAKELKPAIATIRRSFLTPENTQPLLDHYDRLEAQLNDLLRDFFTNGIDFLVDEKLTFKPEAVAALRAVMEEVSAGSALAPRFDGLSKLPSITPDINDAPADIPRDERLTFLNYKTHMDFLRRFLIDVRSLEGRGLAQQQLAKILAFGLKTRGADAHMADYTLSPSGTTDLGETAFVFEADARAAEDGSRFDYPLQLINGFIKLLQTLRVERNILQGE